MSMLVLLPLLARSAPPSCSAPPTTPVKLFSLLLASHKDPATDPSTVATTYVSGYEDAIQSHPDSQHLNFVKVDLYDNDTSEAVYDRITNAFPAQNIHFASAKFQELVDKLPVDYCPTPYKLATLHNPLVSTNVLALYEKYKDELVVLRARAKELHPHVVSPDSGFSADGFGDLEAEITYMRLRELRPSRVLELSPNCGWSGFYILSALAKNGMGHMDSFDMHDCSEKIMNEHAPELKHLRSFHLGDAFASDVITRENYDYFFIDSLHEYEFATTIIDRLFRKNEGRLVGGVHDVYNLHEKPSDEALAFLEYFAGLEGEGGGRELYSVSPMKDISVYAKLMRFRHDMGISEGVDDNVTPCKWMMCANGSLFFSI